MSPRIGHTVLAAGVALLIACAAAAVDQHTPDEGITTWEPAHRPAASLGLDEAIQVALEFDPDIRSAHQQSRFDAGVLRQNTGLFDTSFVCNLGLDVQSNEIDDVADRLDVTSLSFDLGLQKLYRNGVSITPAIEVDSFRTEYVGGGDELTDENTSSAVKLQLDVPLGKGRGKVSTGAAERAARFDFEAALESEAHAGSISALRASLAYWSVVAAQERLDLLDRSVEANRRIVEIGKALVDAGEMVEGDLAQTRARLAEVRAQYVSARLALLQARLALADAMGIVVKRADEAPVAADGWPELPGDDAIAAIDGTRLAEIALSNRRDLAAARLDSESAATLARAARSDLAVTTDLSVTVAYRGFDGDNYLLGGWGEALFGWYPGPSAIVSLGFDWPFGNNVARGRLAQTTSAEHVASIRERDLERVITNNIDKLAGSLLEAVREVKDREAASEYNDAMVKSELEKFQLGESGVVNMIFTEQEQIFQLLSLATARQNLASLLSQLRFETGILVQHRIENDSVVVDGLALTGYEFNP
jgi:outer membrane protein TolC